MFKTGIGNENIEVKRPPKSWVSNAVSETSTPVPKMAVGIIQRLAGVFSPVKT